MGFAPSVYDYDFRRALVKDIDDKYMTYCSFKVLTIIETVGNSFLLTGLIFK